MTAQDNDNQRMNTATPPNALCLMADITDPGSKGMIYRGLAVFAVRQGQQVQVYENRCPHRGIPLEWVADQFLDHSGRLIQCASHGALFLPETGECVAGPCSGQFLRQLPSTLHNGWVCLE